MDRRSGKTPSVTGIVKAAIKVGPAITATTVGGVTEAITAIGDTRVFNANGDGKKDRPRTRCSQPWSHHQSRKTRLQ